MTKRFVVFFYLLVSFHITNLYAESREDPRSNYKKETERIAKDFQKTISNLFSNNLVDQDDLLPKQEKGKRFDSPDPEHAHEIASCPFEKEIVSALERTQTLPPIDPDESFFRKALAASSKPPEGELGIIKIKNHSASFLSKEETCTEGLPRTHSIQEYKKIESIPEQTKDIIYCKGGDRHHKRDEKKYWEGDADKLLERRKAELEKDTSLAWFSVKKTDGKGNSSYKIKQSWRHKDGIQCSNNGTKTVVVSPASKKITWEIQDQALFNYLENNPHCSQVASSLPSENRRRLLYRCEPPDSVACQRIRERGGELLEKICIETDPNGECVLYQKTYAIAETPSIPEIDYAFQKEEDAIWGLNELQVPTNKDPNFQKAISTLYAVSEIEGSSPNNSDPQKAEVFSGKVLRCKTSILGRKTNDCCGVPCKRKNELGIALSAGLGKCSEQEKMLFEARKEKKCSFVGTRLVDLGAFHERTYVCFPTILSRIIQEAAKTQLSRDFGTPEEPNSRGLTLPEIQRLNFDIIDFSDFIDELKNKVDPQTVASTLKDRVASFDQKKSEHKTQQLLKGQMSQVQHLTQNHEENTTQTPLKTQNEPAESFDPNTAQNPTKPLLKGQVERC